MSKPKYEYNKKGKIIKTTYPSGRIHTYKYDNDNNLKKIYINDKLILEFL